ncbi:MAG: hypothetical protein MUE30_14175 [Spirosomaceae bacterium]|nr:hypothetical protein [Spirosomataceae bacterium]
MTLRWFWCCLGMLGIVGVAQAQDTDEYYRASKRRKNLTWLRNSDLVRSSNHWYVGIEGGGKWNGTTLSDNLSGFIDFQPKFTDSYASGYLGYSHRLRWAVEAGYGRTPTNALLAFFTARRRFTLPLNENAVFIPLRFKYRVLRIGKIQKLSGLYAGVGALWMPTRKSTTIERFNTLIGYRRVADTTPAQFDTLVVQHETVLTGKPKMAWEGSVELVGRIARRWELVAYGRAHYAFRSPMEANTQLLINRQTTATSLLTIRPLSYQFGVAVRFLYNLQDQYRSRFDE